MDIFSVISMLGGLALFLYGMEVMGDGLRNSSGSVLKKILSKVTSNPFSGFLLGVVITAVVQSSMATVMLTVGLVGAGVLTLKQSISIVFGANVGTTVTAQIIRFIDTENSTGGGILRFFQPSVIAPIALVIGVILVLFVKSSSGAKNIGNITVGFGVLFTGLMNMIAATSGLAQSETFTNIILKFSENPFLGTLVGMLITIMIQSSSASVGVLQTLCVTGAVTFSGMYTYILGAAIGTGAVTFIMCSLDKKKDSKRIGLIHLCFNIIGAVVFFIGMGAIKMLGGFDGLWNKTVTGGDTANFETAFKFITAMLLIFFIPAIERLSLKIIKPDSAKTANEWDKLDENLFLSPGVALAQTEEVIGTVGRTALSNLKLARQQFAGFDKKRHAAILADEDKTDAATDAAEKFLIAMSPSVENQADSDRQSYLLRVVNEFERIGDLALNLSETAEYMANEGISFSSSASAEIEVLFDAVDKVVNEAYSAFGSRDPIAAKRVEPVEEVVDDIVETLRKRHYDRLKNGKCSPQTGLPFMDVLSNCERISDQCSNLALYIMGLYDTSVRGREHDYIKTVHSGSDNDFVALYRENSREFMPRLEKIQKT